MRILLPSIVDPTFHRGGAGTATRAFVKLMERDPLNGHIRVILPKSVLQRSHRIRQFTSLARSLILSLPSKADFTYSRRFLHTIRRSVREQEFDLVVLNGSDLLWLLPELPPGIPRILFAHNIEHQLYLSQIKSVNPPSRLLRNVLLRDWRRLREYERSGMSQIENIIFLSNHDAEFALQACPNIKALIVPPLFDYQPQTSCAKVLTGGTEIGFMANFGWWPNREGLRWFLRNVFPYTKSSTRLHLFGEGSHNVVPHQPRIVKHGFLSRIEEIWDTCHFMICPMFSGGGVSIKLAEMVYNGVPVVSTRFASQGLPLALHPGIVLLDRAEEWIEFLRSPAAQALGHQRGPAPMATAFAIDAHVERVQAFVGDVLQGPNRG